MKAPKISPLISSLVRGQRPAATYRDAANSPLETIEATATRTVAETWGCWR